MRRIIPKTRRLLTKENKSHLFGFLRNRDFVLNHPDKEASTVLLGCLDYVIKLSSILSDADKLSKEIIQKDATKEKGSDVN